MHMYVSKRNELDFKVTPHLGNELAEAIAAR